MDTTRGPVMPQTTSWLRPWPVPLEVEGVQSVGDVRGRAVEEASAHSRLRQLSMLTGPPIGAGNRNAVSSAGRWRLARRVLGGQWYLPAATVRFGEFDDLALGQVLHDREDAGAPVDVAAPQGERFLGA